MPNTLRSRNNGKLVLEMIDFQLNDKFGRDMELHITEIVAAVKEKFTDKAITQLEAYKALHSTIFKRLNMRVKITVDKALAAIMPLYSNQHHVLLDRMWHGQLAIPDQTKFMQSVNNRVGTVDNKNAKLGGFFSEFEHSVYINFRELVNEYNMSPAEITAILLHELGHGFYACEYSDRLSSGNQVLANLAKEMAKEKTKRNPEYVYKELLKINPETKKQMVDEIVLGNRVIPGGEAFKYTLETISCQLENFKYDETSFENLADNFAARFGYGAALVSGLQRLYSDVSEYQMRRTGFLSIAAAIILLTAITVTLVLAGSIAIAMFYGFIGFMLGTLLFFSSGEYGRDYTYDDLKIRYKRVRDQLVQQIKSKKYNVSDAIQLAKQIEFMDDIIMKTKVYRSSLDFIMNYIRPSNFRAKKSIERQQLLEDLATNDLFIQSLKLQSLATL